MTLPTATLTRLTATMPCKTIAINGQPYLRRYYAGETPCHHDLWLHEFLSSDGERHLHNHPWEARSVVLTGGYIEELPASTLTRLADHAGYAVLSDLESGITPSAPRDAYLIAAVTHWHRIAAVLPGTWTAMFVRPQREKYWYFRDGDQRVRMVASPRDWWQDCLTRDALAPS